MPETPQEYAARIAERNRVDAYMSQKLAERRASMQGTNRPITDEQLATHRANEVKSWFTPPVIQFLARILGAQPFAGQPNAQQSQVLQDPRTQQLQQQVQGNPLRLQ
jgi:hypothetical protein